MTDFALRATKVTVRSLGKVMSTMSPSLSQPGRDEGHRQGTLSRCPISQAGLFSDTVERFAQQFSVVQQQTEAIQHILPRRDAPSTAAPGASLPVGALLHPPELLRPRSNRHLGRRVEPLAGERRPLRPSQAPSHPDSRRSGPDAGNPEMLEFALSQETARTAPLLPPVEGREENIPFHFVSVPPFGRSFPFRSVVEPTFTKKEQFPFPPGSQVHGTTVCDALLPHSRPQPILPVAKRAPLANSLGTQGVR